MEHRYTSTIVNVPGRQEIKQIKADPLDNILPPR